MKMWLIALGLAISTLAACSQKSPEVPQSTHGKFKAEFVKKVSMFSLDQGTKWEGYILYTGELPRLPVQLTVTVNGQELGTSRFFLTFRYARLTVTVTREMYCASMGTPVERGHFFDRAFEDEVLPDQSLSDEGTLIVQITLWAMDPETGELGKYLTKAETRVKLSCSRCGTCRTQA